MAITIGTGTTITFDSGFFAEILSIGWSGIARAPISSSHMGTTNAMTFEPAKLYDPGEIEVEIHFQRSATPPFLDAAETVTITWAGGGTWAASGFLTGFEITDEFEDKITARATIKFSGAITVTPPA